MCLGKEARRKELKKNKKQRLIVRQSVIKAKDPTNVLTELEALDRMGLFFHCFFQFKIDNLLIYFQNSIQTILHHIM